MVSRLPELALLCLMVFALAAMVRERARRRLAEAEASAQRQSRDATLRLLRLATGDQRTVALTLFGHAQNSVPEDSALTGLARRLLDLSEDLAERTEQPEATRYLQEDVLEMGPVVAFAVAQVTAQLGPSERAWRIDPAVQDLRLLADRRALNQILVNVLSGAAATTRGGDWIEIAVQDGPDGVLLAVQDEGVGLPVAADADPGESRGIGLGLTLARSLMQAHGGGLNVVSAERVGTRVELAFPAQRVIA